MNVFLPDVNALLALLEPMHVHHDSAHCWYVKKSPMRLLRCSHVENGVIRVASPPKYANCLGTSSRVREILQGFVNAVDVVSCESDVSLLDVDVLLEPESLTPSRVADLYLLALAASQGARLATFDLRIPADSVRGGLQALEIIPVRTGIGE